MATADVDEPSTARHGYRPWLQRRIEASALSPLSAGLALALAQLGLFFAWHALGWALGVGDPNDPFFWQQMFGPNVINAALIGYAPAAMTWSRRQAVGELGRLSALLPEGGDELRRRVEEFPRLPMALAGRVAIGPGHSTETPTRDFFTASSRASVSISATTQNYETL